MKFLHPMYQMLSYVWPTGMKSMVSNDYVWTAVRHSNFFTIRNNLVARTIEISMYAFDEEEQVSNKEYCEYISALFLLISENV